MPINPQQKARLGQAILLFLLMLPTMWVQAQHNQITQGRIVDANTGEPVPFVTLSVADGKWSNETNTDGYFVLTLPDAYKQDTLTITAINYRPAQIPLTLGRADFVIRLEPQPLVDQTAPDNVYFRTERAFVVRDTLLKVVASIARNYSARPTLLHGFYRETIRADHSDFYGLYTEGLIDVYKPSYYFIKKEDQIHFIKGRRKPLKALTIPVLTPGPWVTTMLDVIKYQEFLFRNGKVNKDYVFEMAGETVHNNRLIYIIHFRPLTPTAASGYFVGNLFIESGSLAIVRADYALTSAGMTILNRSRYA